MTKLQLSSWEVTKLVEAQNALLSPFEYESRADWLIACLGSIRDLIGADAAAAQDPVDPRFVISSEYSPTTLEPYLTLLQDVESRFMDHSRFSELGAWNRGLVYADQIDTYHRSKYFQEFIVPLRGFDAVGLSVSLSGRNDISDNLQLIFHHEHRDGRQFGERGLALLKLVYPAFCAGAQILARAEKRRESTAGVLDAIGDRVRLYNLDGNVLHESRELTRLLTGILSESALSENLDYLARKIIASATADRQATRHAVNEVVQTASGRFQIRSIWIPGGLLEVNKCLLLVVDPLDGLHVALDELIGRFGLTRRESEVALLLSKRKSNREIAGTLVISEHTARRHTEHVMAKLGVHSRREVEIQLGGHFSG